MVNSNEINPSSDKKPSDGLTGDDSSQFRFTHGSLYLVEKSWDLIDTRNLMTDECERATKIVFGSNQKDITQTYVVNMNQNCSKCPERTANKTKYRLLDYRIPVQYRYKKT